MWFSLLNTCGTGHPESKALKRLAIIFRTLRGVGSMSLLSTWGYFDPGVAANLGLSWCPADPSGTRSLPETKRKTAVSCRRRSTGVRVFFFLMLSPHGCEQRKISGIISKAVV